MMTCDAIVLSAGQGRRFGKNKPKQYNLLDGKEIIIHTLERISKANNIRNIILVVNETYMDYIHSLLWKFKVNKIHCITIGGLKRVDSVHNGVILSTADFVAIHDGARPFVKADKIDAVIEKAFETDAAILATPANETVKIASEGFIIDTPDRKKLWFAKTPQVFKRELFSEFIEKLPSDFIPTDDAQIFEYFNKEVSIIEDEPTNIKITYPHDIEIGKLLLQEDK